MGDIHRPAQDGTDLFEGLSKPERRFLRREYVLERHTPACLAFLRSVPYPFEKETAAAVLDISRRYVCPWPALRDRHVRSWTCDQLVAEWGVNRIARGVPDRSAQA